MDVSYQIGCILKERTITDFLTSRGISPVKRNDDRLTYRCPVHEGDNDPSFIVYPVGTEDREYQTCHCFGCHAGITVINLMSEMDGISLRESIKRLAKGLDIKDEDILESIIKDLERHKGLTLTNIDEMALKINRICYEYLKDVGFDKEEKEFFENIYTMVDKVARDNDYETLSQMYDSLLDKGIHKRIRYYQEKQEKGVLDKFL